MNNKNNDIPTLMQEETQLDSKSKNRPNETEKGGKVSESSGLSMLMEKYCINKNH